MCFRLCTKGLSIDWCSRSAISAAQPSTDCSTAQYRLAVVHLNSAQSSMTLLQTKLWIVATCCLQWNSIYYSPHMSHTVNSVLYYRSVKHNPFINITCTTYFYFHLKSHTFNLFLFSYDNLISSVQPKGLKVREAAGVLFVLIGNGEDGLLKLVVAELLKSHRGRNGWKDRDICVGKGQRETCYNIIIRK